MNGGWITALNEHHYDFNPRPDKSAPVLIASIPTESLELVQFINLRINGVQTRTSNRPNPYDYFEISGPRVSKNHQLVVRVTSINS